MVSRGIGRRKKGVSSVGAEFFKIYMPDRHSEQLLIPPHFIKHFSRTIRDRVILKDIKGKKWHVDVGKIPDGVFFKNGWQTFVSDHSLKVGELLTFRYDGSFQFFVQIYGTNGCKKSFDDKNTEAHVKIEEEDEIELKPTPEKRARPNEQGESQENSERSDEGTQSPFQTTNGIAENSERRDEGTQSPFETTNGIA